MKAIQKMTADLQKAVARREAEEQQQLAKAAAAIGKIPTKEFGEFLAEVRTVKKSKDAKLALIAAYAEFGILMARNAFVRGQVSEL